MHNSEEKPTSIGIGYHHHHHHQNMFHQTASTFDPNNQASSEIYNMDMMIGFPPKNISSKEAINEEYNYQNGTIMMVSTADHPASGSAWNINSIDQSLRSCVFPCEGNERPSQGLSLSLNTSNPSSIGIQSFELRQQQISTHDEDHLRFGPSSSRSININQQQQQGHHGGGGGGGGGLVQFHAVRNSKYLGPVQELLNEFCNLGIKQIDENLKMKKTNEWGQDEINGVKRQSFYSSLDLLELQKRKSKLFHMLEEVDRRYKHYCDQMKSVVSSFEAVAGNGAAKVYSSLASKAMSRHFRCLRDGIVSEIKATKKAMGDKDTTSTSSNAGGGALGTSKGETPRLRLLDQTLRQQKAFQQMNMIESHPWRPQRGLPERSVSVLRAWLFEHFLHPYPNDVDKHILARQTGLSRSQVSNWFINARVRLWKPMVEEMYLEELKEHDHHELNNVMVAENDEKPSHQELLARNMDSECLSSIINHQNDHVEKRKNKSKNINEEEEEEDQEFGRVNMGSDSYGSAMELDFSSYNHHHHHHHHHNYGGNSGVSLTLGLHQHEHGGNGGVSLAFSPAASQQQGGSLFYHRGNNKNNKIEDYQTTTTTVDNEYSLLESDQNQNLPYRNLMGAQLLRDFAG